MKKITSFWGMLALNAYWIGLSFKWNALHPIVLPAVLLNYVPDAQKNTYLGLLTFTGLAVATVMQPLAGALSDGWRSRWGRRRPLMVIGMAFDVLFLAVLGWAGDLFWLFIGYVGLQVTSNLGQGPAQGLLPDRVAESKVGAASGLKTFMDMAALIVASLAAGRLLDPETRDPSLIMAVLIGTMLVFTAITVFGTREEPSDSPRSEAGFGSLSGNRPGRRAARKTSEAFSQFKIDFRRNTAYWWLIGQRFVFLLGIYGVQAFAQYYLQDVLQVADPPKQTGDLLAALTVALVLLAVSGGWLSDRFGEKKLLYAAGILATVGFLLLRLAQTPVMLMVYGAVLGAGIGLFLTSNWALANKLAPSAEAGKYLGLTNIATAGAGALARLEGPVIDAVNAAMPGAWWGYTGLFVFGAVCAVGSMLLLRKIPDKG
ncbi:MAG: MFS transporter [Chloroflexota bacterium]